MKNERLEGLLARPRQPAQPQLPAEPVFDAFDPLLQFLEDCSEASLDEFLLNRLSRAANLRKDLKRLEDELRIAEAECMFARYLRRYRADVIALLRRKAEEYEQTRTIIHESPKSKRKQGRRDVTEKE